MPARSATFFVASLLAVCTPAIAAKRPLTHQDYDAWRSIISPAVSNDGHYLAYGLFPQEGDGVVVVRDLRSNKEWRENAGALPPPPVPDPNIEEPVATARTMRLAISADSRTVVFLAFPRKADTDKAKNDKKKPDEMPKGELVTIDLATGTPARVVDVKSFALPDRGNGFLAYLKEAVAGSNKDMGTDLVLQNLTTHNDRNFANVIEYNLSRDGKTLAWAVASPQEESDGVYALATAGGERRTLLSGKGKYAKIAWADKQDELAFVSNREDASSKQTRYKLYLWNLQSPQATEVVSIDTPGFRKGFAISEKATLSFSKDGGDLYFGAAPPALPLPKEHTGPATDDEVSFDLWNYKDDHVQPMQKVRAVADNNRSYRAVFHIAGNKLVQLADDSMFEALPSENGRYAIGKDDREYRPMQEYSELYADSYFVDTGTGSRKLIASRQVGAVTWSPDGKYALMFNGRDWLAQPVSGTVPINLTSKLGVAFHNEETDTPGTPGPYGWAGWTNDGKYVLLYEHFDIWRVSPDGSSAKNLTNGFGRKENIQLRYVKLDAEEKAIDAAKPLLLRGEDVKTRATGFFRTRVDSDAAPEKLLMAAKDFGLPIKAKDADVLVFRQQTFNEFPDLMVAGADMKDPRKVTDANPQKADLNWGTAEMIPFRNLDGVPLQGVLYKPENFDPNKKYPMIVYIYERLSQNFNHFVDPSPMTSINSSYYVSNGYLVFTPDIVYKTGYPGQSALKCVMAGVDAVVARGFVDENNIGIQGHSWGGYQISYMLTQTNRFKAAEAGAPVANMTSAYDGIRWGTGRPRQFQYEQTQSRIGGSLWQYPMRFIENSPVFMADRIQTPMLILQNDMDDAVPFYQGIEMFLALRRLGKESYMFTYNGEPHSIRHRANQKDFTTRMSEYFDYELKGARKPAWMEHGIPYLDKGREKAPTDQ